MAESISIHFKTATWDELRPFINSIATWDEEHQFLQRWLYPKFNTNQEFHENDAIEVTLYAYDEILNEYEDEEIDEIVAALGDLPSSSLTIELRRSKGAQACDAAADIAAQVLQQFDGVVDDGYEIWTPAEIARNVNDANPEHGGFLDCYRVGTPAYERWYQRWNPEDFQTFKENNHAR